MESLVAVLQHDAPYDTEIAKATLETLMQLCEVAEKVSFFLTNWHLKLTFSQRKKTWVCGTLINSWRLRNLSTPSWPYYPPRLLSTPDFMSFSIYLNSSILVHPLRKDTLCRPHLRELTVFSLSSMLAPLRQVEQQVLGSRAEWVGELEKC